MIKKNLLKNEEAVSPVVGVVLMVAITVVLAATVYVMVNNLGNGNTEPIPTIALSYDTNGYLVTHASDGLTWDQLTVTGCSTIPTGNVTAGQSILDCNDSLIITYGPSNTVIYAD